jgi:hypothetical protein
MFSIINSVWVSALEFSPLFHKREGPGVSSLVCCPVKFYQIAGEIGVREEFIRGNLDLGGV